MSFVYLTFFVIIAIVLGKIHNKFIIKQKKVFRAITMIIFISTSILLFVAMNIKSYIHSSIKTCSNQIEHYIYNNYPNISGIGIDLNNTNNCSLQASEIVSSLSAMIPAHTELNVNKMIYDAIVGASMERLLKQLEIVDFSVAPYCFSLADKNNFRFNPS
ncbi:MAG: hypothetical protein FWF51_08800 [Chitinivibrionia bacterium]|nr:hypothetical protein [Chitinivibrionia bacterium]